jgi:carbonic anhydrase
MARADLDRRSFLWITATGALVSVAPAGLLAIVPAHRPSAPRTPDESLQALLAGNARYVANQMTSSQQNLKALREQTVDSQHPFAAVLACADSRVPVELLFDQTIGSVFVTRVAGNIVTPEIVASLEYAVAALGVTAIVVLGHSACGAIKAAMTTEGVPGQISTLYPPLRPAIEASGGSLPKAVEANAMHQADLLRTASTVCQGAIAKGTLKVTAAVYDLGSGKVTTR